MQGHHPNHPKINAAIKRVSEWDGVTGVWVYISFVDPERPKGDRFLGGCIVRSPDVETSIIVAMQRRCNPGGEACMTPIDQTLASAVDPQYTYRLLSKDQLDLMEANIKSNKKETVN